MIDLRDRIKEEFFKCASDPVYFMRKYYMIQHPTLGRQLFDLYEFQEKVLKIYQNHEYVIINKSRQLGISTLVSAYALWMMLFNKDKNILVIATTQATAKNMVTKVRFAYQNLPAWLKIGHVEDNRLSLRLVNGSQIKAVSSAGDSARSEAVSLLIIDEAAFIDRIEEIFTSAQQTLATGGRCIALSTPNGVGNWFHKMYTKAQKKEDTKFIPVSLPWTVHPHRDQAWRDQQTKELGIRNAAQECFSYDVRLFTDGGMIPISKINIGDKVLTHTGEYKKVVRVYKKESNNLFKISSSKNTKKSYVTKDHPFLYDENRLIWREVSQVEKAYTFPKKVRINTQNNLYDLYENTLPLHFKKVLLGDVFYINDRKHKIKHNATIEFGYTLGKIIGLYLAEGSKCRLRVVYSFNYNKELNTWVNELQDNISNVFGIDRFKIRRQGNSGQLSICSDVFSQFLDKLVEGDCCNNKKLTRFCYEQASLDFFKGVLDGYLLGDGCLKQEYNKSYITTSEDLYYDIYYISNLLGANNISLKYPKSLEVELKEVMGRECYCHPKFNASYLKTLGKDANSIYDGGDRIVNLIKEEVDDDYACLVYNIEVEDDHSYVTEYGVVHNCDCDFATSGNSYIEPEILSYYEMNFITEPYERRGMDKALWIWEYPDPVKHYMIVADVARGDGSDYSAFHVIDIETVTQVAEFKAQIDTREYANILLATANEYNQALLVIENANIGWDVVQSIVESGYTNLHYSHKADVDGDFQKYMDRFDRASGMTPGFTMTQRTRPLVLEKMRDFVENKVCTIRSVRLLEELRVFIWKNGKQQAMQGYNDDLVMSFAMGMYLRETSLRFRKTMDNLAAASLNNFSKTNTDVHFQTYTGINNNPWSMNISTPQGSENIDISWLI